MTIPDSVIKAEAIRDDRPLRVAMIGAGRMANRVHYPSLAGFHDVELAAICDLDAGRRDETADAYGVDARYADYQRMIEEIGPDAVYSIGPPHVMYDTWIWCLERGFNLFIEKPMGMTLHQSQMLATLAAEHGCITQVGFQRRSTPITAQMRDACLARGPITHAVVRFYKNQITPFTGAIDHMLDDGTHAIDTLRWLCGGEAVAIDSTVARCRVPDINLITATIQFSTGAIGVLMANWASGRRTFSIEMHAPGICAEVDPEDTATLYADGDTTGQRVHTADAAKSDEFFVYGGFQAKSREFIDAIRAGRQPSSNFGDALKTMEIAHQILAQATLAGY
jgi:predicted dehydrogenase